MNHRIAFDEKINAMDKTATRAAERLIAKHVARQISEAIDRGHTGESAIRIVGEWWQDIAKLAVQNATTGLLDHSSP